VRGRQPAGQRVAAPRGARALVGGPRSERDIDGLAETSRNPQALALSGASPDGNCTQTQANRRLGDSTAMATNHDAKAAAISMLPATLAAVGGTAVGTIAALASPGAGHRGARLGDRVPRWRRGRRP